MYISLHVRNDPPYPLKLNQKNEKQEKRLKTGPNQASINEQYDREQLTQTN